MYGRNDPYQGREDVCTSYEKMKIVVPILVLGPFYMKQNMNVLSAIVIGLLFFILLSGFIRMESRCLKVRRNFLVAIDTYLHRPI